MTQSKSAIVETGAIAASASLPEVVAHIDELYQLFYVAAYGCNRKCREEIRRLFCSRGQDPAFLFFEYFLTHPILKEGVTPKGWDADWEDTVHLLTPFAPRLEEGRNSRVVYKEERAIFTFPRTFHPHPERMIFPWKSSLFARDAWHQWSSTAEGGMSPRKHRAGSKTVTYRPVRIGNGTASSSEAASFGELDGWTYAWQSKWAETLSSPTKKSARVLAKMLAPLFIDNDPTVVPGLMIPIASARLFYGSIWIMLPGFDTSISALASNANVRCLRKELGLRLADLIERTYLPTLTVLHEHWLEKQHKEAIGKPTDPTHLPNLRVKLSDDDSDFKAWTRNSFQLIDPLPRPRARKDRLADRLETVMSELWQKRGISGALSSRATAYEESLVFAKYVIGSESMLEKLGQLAESAATLRKSRETLPACLIVGGAGSGKDKFAKLLRLFSRDPEKIKPGEASKGYYAGEVTTMNLAAVRPAPLTASIMTGIEVCADAVLAKDCESRPFETVWRMEGVLQRVRSKNSGAKRDKDAGPPTLVLDEFNSMDPDSQGVLLRFLDNSEIIPVGGMADLKHESTDCLIIGIMNEDPEDISREKSVAFLKQGEYLGKFVGDLLYEHFLKLRRLRPDVMYRMMRNGKFIIPDLRDRRDDIPLLFYFSVESELKSMPGVAKSSAMILHIPLEVLDRLTQLDLDWSGNVRQLQALAKIVAGRVATSEPDPAFSIRLSDVEDALQEVALVGRARGN